MPSLKTLPHVSFSRFFPPRLRRVSRPLVLAMIVLAIVTVTGVAAWQYNTVLTQQRQLQQQHQALVAESLTLEETLLQTELALETLQNEDQVMRNQTLQAEINDLQRVFRDSVTAYERLLQLDVEGAQSQPLETQFTRTLVYLSQRNYASASAQLTQLNQEIARINQERLAAVPPPPANIPAIQEAPASGHQRQLVNSDVGTFQVDVIAADLNSTRVQVETASEGDCTDGCPVDSLATFVARSGGFAGINGPYFCPAEYPSCAGKTNSFDTLLMNKNKVYFNSDNNVYSTVPAVIFSGNSARFVGQSLEWGRDTGVDAVIASQPLLLSGGEIRFGGSGDPKQGSRGSRSFIGTRDNTVYIGVVRNATVAEVAHVLRAMGLQNALNLDSGGSTALMLNGRYLAGPGRNTPFGIVLVRK